MFQKKDTPKKCNIERLFLKNKIPEKKQFLRSNYFRCTFSEIFLQIRSQRNSEFFYARVGLFFFGGGIRHQKGCPLSSENTKFAIERLKKVLGI
jgi:hypothetical protein